MNRIIVAVAAAVGLAASIGTARADFGGPPGMPAPPVPAYGAGYGAPAPDSSMQYGLNPFLRKCLFWKSGSAGCSTCPPNAYGMGRGGMPAGPPGVGMPGTPGSQMPGTLVFPHHFYVRSPRDFFMADTRRP